MLRFGAFLLTLSAASAGTAMTIPTDSTYMPARPIEARTFWQPQAVGPVEQASRAFGRCVRAGIRSLDANVEAEAAAASVVNGCAAQLNTVRLETERVIAAAHWTESRKDVARAELRARLDQAAQRISATIRQSRSRSAAAR